MHCPWFLNLIDACIVRTETHYPKPDPNVIQIVFTCPKHCHYNGLKQVLTKITRQYIYIHKGPHKHTLTHTNSTSISCLCHAPCAVLLRELVTDHAQYKKQPDHTEHQIINYVHVHIPNTKETSIDIMHCIAFLHRTTSIHIAHFKS